MHGDDYGEWEYLYGSALAESLDAAGIDACMHAPGPSLPARAIPARQDSVPLDLRHLPAPEPFERALLAVDALLPGAQLELLTPMLPLPLIELLAARGFVVCARRLDDGTAHVDVSRPAD